jgi:uncharacterized membrane protein YraQ (UPF0718 family)
MSFFSEFAGALAGLLVETGWWLLVGLAAAGLVHAFVPGELLKHHLGRPGLGSILKASGAGVVLPLCSCAVIPVAAGLRRDGASKGASAAFAISTPQTGEESIPLTWALLGPVFAIVRPVVALVTAVIAGTLIDRFAAAPTGRTPEPAPARPGCCQSVSLQVSAPTTCGCAAPAPPSCCATTADQASRLDIGRRLIDALRYGFVTLPTDLAVWLTVGFVLSALIAAAVPEGWLAAHAGSGLLPMLVMLVVGIPIYICATGSTPLAYTLVAAGLSPGAALVLLLAGPATNTATVAWALKDLGVRATVIYLATIALVALAAGVALDLVALDAVRGAAEAASASEPTALGIIGAVLLAVLGGGALAAKGADRLGSRPGSPAEPCCSASPSTESTHA